MKFKVSIKGPTGTSEHDLESGCLLGVGNQCIDWLFGTYSSSDLYVLVLRMIALVYQVVNESNMKNKADFSKEAFKEIINDFIDDLYSGEFKNEKDTSNLVAIDLDELFRQANGDKNNNA